MRLLVLAVVLGSLLRLIGIGSLPPGFTPDEAAFGYNAYSLIHTGRDEWRVPFYQLPLTNLHSFGDDKLPLYTFFTVPMVFLGGLNEVSARLPNALLGILAIPVIYLLVRHLTGKSTAAGWAAVLYAVSPWSVQLSRGAFEANGVVTLLLIALVLALRKLPATSALFAGLTMFMYHSGRLITLPVLLTLYIIIKPHGFRRFMLGSCLMLLPVIFSVVLFGNARAKDVTILTPTDNWRSVADRRFAATVDGFPDVLSRLFVNKPVALLQLFTTNYLSYVSPQFLFLSGPAESTYGMLKGIGVMHPVELATLAAAVIWCLRRPSRLSLFLVCVAGIALVPAALSKGPGLAANRAAFFLAPVVITSALGISLISRLRWRWVYYGWIGLFALNVVFFTQTYFVYAKRDLAKPMLYGYREAFIRTQPLINNYAEIRVSRSLSEPHIYTAFFNQLDPQLYQTAALSWQGFSQRGFSFLDQVDGYRLGNYRFGSLFSTPITRPTLLIGKPEDFPANYPQHFTVNYPDGTPAVIVSAAQP